MLENNVKKLLQNTNEISFDKKNKKKYKYCFFYV